MEWAHTLTLLAATPGEASASAVQWVLVFIGAGIALGGLAAGFYGARQKGIIELLKTENTAYKESNARLHEENNTLKQTCAQATAEAKMWRDNVTQRPSIEKLITNSNKQHAEYMLKMGELTKAVTRALEELGKNGNR
jgi:hypothetical protein